jgi:sulfatase maturation enzyme AslB (radical SAM superfamily)
MPWPVLRAAIDRLLESTEAEVSLQFTGGEPLLAFPSIRRAVSYLERKRPDGREVSYDIVSNGTLIESRHIRFFADRRFNLQISFDGAPAAQALRGRGTFERLDRLLDRLRDQDPRLFHTRLRVAVTVAIQAVPHLADSIDYLLDKGVREIALSPAMGQALPWRPSDIDLLDRQMSRIFDASIRHYQRMGQVPLLLFRKEEAERARSRRSRFICSAAEGGAITVDVDGQVYACGMLAESFQTFPDTPLRRRLSAMRLGDIRDPGLSGRLRALPDAAAATGIFDHKETKYSSYGRCATCRFLASCSVCPMAVARDPERADPDRLPDFLCAFNQVSLAYRKRFPRQPSPLAVLTGRVPLTTLLGPRGPLASHRARAERTRTPTAART